MSDAATIALAVSVWLGAWTAVPVPSWPGLVLVAAGLSGRWAVVLVVGAAALSSGHAARAWAGLELPADREVQGWAVLVADPVDEHGAVRAEVRLGGRHLDAWARRGSANVLRQRLAGELVEVGGRISPLSPLVHRFLAPRHIAGRLDVEDIGGWRPAGAAGRFANGLRRTLERGARPLDDESRSLLLGVVLGDDRGRPDHLSQDFRAAGLSHLLAVSGQNVAFVLVLGSPLLRRMGLVGRWVATIAVLVTFGVLTRWEPSVVRASVMAAIACTASTIGRPASRLRILALAVAAAVLVDPLLVHSVGFQLSVGATFGIAAFAVPLRERFRGPGWLREALAVTIAAQVGVLPVAVPVFGGVPLASIPANLLAVPAAAPLTMWGLVAGMAAGRIGPPWDAWLHVPTRLLAGWLAGVAGWAAGLPLGSVRAPHVLGVLAAVGAVALRHEHRRGRSTRAPKEARTVDH